MVNGGLQNVLVTCIYLALFHCRVPKFLARGPLLPNFSLPEDVFGWSQICSNQSHCTAADRIMGAQAVLYLEGSCESVLCTNWLHNLFKLKIQLQHTCQPTGQVLTGVQGALCRNLTSSMTSARTLATSGWSAISSQMLLLYPHAWPCGPRAPTSLVGGPANGGAAASHLPIQRLRCHRSSFGGARYRFELQSSSTSYTRATQA